MMYENHSCHRLMGNTADTDDMGRTTIQVSDELADELHGRKGRGDSYEDVIWRFIDDTTEDRGGERRGRNADVDETPSTPDHDTEPARPPEPSDSGLEALLADVEFPSSKSREECVDAVEAAYAYLQREGSSTMREFVREVLPEHPLGYDVPELESGERYRGAWWRRIVKPGLEALPDVESPPSGASEWRYTG